MQDGLREVLDRHHTALISDLDAQFDREMELKIAAAVAAERERAENELASVRERITNEAARESERVTSEFTQTLSGERARAAEESRLRLSESLNQTLRRIRHTAAEHEALQLLLEDSPADRAVVLLIENNQARVAAWRNVQLRDEDEDRTIDLADAAALASCAETRDPLVALTSPAEISSILSLALSSTIATEPGGPAAKAYLFPITVRQITVAVMLASGDVSPAPIELLCEAVGMKLESLDIAQASSAPAPLVNIAAARPQTEKPKATEDATSWSKLNPEQQALHLRAQRFARVRTAQIRISEPDDLRRGAQQADIYSALRRSIDAARHDYERSFMSQSPTMVDYLHLEFIRSLAREHSELMGPNYPGPLD
jgi:hypothetical protein